MSQLLRAVREDFVHVFVFVFK